jgi:hypothetical protein
LSVSKSGESVTGKQRIDVPSPEVLDVGPVIRERRPGDIEEADRPVGVHRVPDETGRSPVDASQIRDVVSGVAADPNRLELASAHVDEISRRRQPVWLVVGVAVVRRIDAVALGRRDAEFFLGTVGE